MKRSELHENLRHSGRRNRLVVVSAGVIMGIAGISLAYTELKTHPGLQAATVAVSASLLWHKPGTKHSCIFFNKSYE
jgi:hypothetical protein